MLRWCILINEIGELLLVVESRTEECDHHINHRGERCYIQATAFEGMFNQLSSFKYIITLIVQQVTKEYP